MIQTQLRNPLRRIPPTVGGNFAKMTIDEPLNFGKYKGISVSDVFKKDPGYYSWMLNSDFTLNTKAVLTKIKLREFNGK